jgi:hypothetical protein
MSEKWQSIKRTSSTVPFGYYEDEEDPQLLHPNEHELEALEKAKNLVNKKQYYSTVAEWLRAETGRYISKYGLMKRIQADKKKRRTNKNA